MKRAYENFQTLKRITSLFILTSLFCGKVVALPQNWLCDEIMINKITELRIDDVSFSSLYRGKSEKYLLEMTLNGLYDFPNSTLQCGSSGCIGKLTNLDTSESEEMRFDCRMGSTIDTLFCYRLSGDEYILSKFSNNEYRVELCDSYYKYILLDECSDCFCIVHDSRKNDTISDLFMKCILSNEEILHCFNRDAYEWQQQYKKKCRF